MAPGTATGDASVGTDTFTGCQQRHRLRLRRHADRRRRQQHLRRRRRQRPDRRRRRRRHCDLPGPEANTRSRSILRPATRRSPTTWRADGTDTLTNVEVLQFTNSNLLIASGSSTNPVDLSDTRLFFGRTTRSFTALTGSTDDFVKIRQSLSKRLIDLGGGQQRHGHPRRDRRLQPQSRQRRTPRRLGGDDFVGFLSNVNGLTIDMGGGNDNVNLANGSNSVSVTNVENLNGSDFAAGSVSNDTLTLLNDVSGLPVNLGQRQQHAESGGRRQFVRQRVQRRHGQRHGVRRHGYDRKRPVHSMPTISRSTSVAATTPSFFGSQFLNVALHNVEHLVGSAQDDFYTLTNNVTGLTRRPRHRQQQPSSRVVDPTRSA